MITLSLKAKVSMSHLLLKETFDKFSFIEADITTFNRFTIDGFLQKDFFDEQPAEAHARWKDVREHCFRIIRGQRTPLNFKIVLSLAPSHFDAFLKKEQLTGFTAGDIQGLYLNFHYDGTDLHCITGISLWTSLWSTRGISMSALFCWKAISIRQFLCKLHNMRI